MANKYVLTHCNFKRPLSYCCPPGFMTHLMCDPFSYNCLFSINKTWKVPRYKITFCIHESKVKFDAQSLVTQLIHARGYWPLYFSS